MAEYDVAIIGGGPAGLTAGLYLVRGKRRTILLEKESFGGNIKNVEWIENYPGFADGVSGARLASEMQNQAVKQGLQVELAEVTGIEIYSSSMWVGCAGGKGYTASAVIIASGSRFKKLGVPGEDKLQGKGVFGCALCDGGHFSNKTVAICGGGDSGVTEALYMTKLATRVILFELMPSLTATAVLQEKAKGNPKLEIHCSAKVEAIIGDNKVEAIDFMEVASGNRRTLKVDGVLVAVGLEPNTGFLNDVVPLDSKGQVMANDRMETEVPGIFTAGDVRRDSPRQVSTAVGDGTTAAIYAEKFLREQA